MCVRDDGSIAMRQRYTCVKSMLAVLSAAGKVTLKHALFSFGKTHCQGQILAVIALLTVWFVS